MTKVDQSYAELCSQHFDAVGVTWQNIRSKIDSRLELVWLKRNYTSTMYIWILLGLNLVSGMAKCKSSDF